jgi:S-adenosylmethionine decarboxylase
MNTRVAVGTHALADCWGCRPAALTSADALLAAVCDAASAAGATVLDARCTSFPAYPGTTGAGLTAIAVLAESHAAVHTYPETGYAAVDVFTCGTRCDPRAALDALIAFLAPSDVSVEVLTRGG